MEAIFSYDRLPGRVVFGPGSLARATDELAGFHRILLIASKSVPIPEMGQVATFTEVRQHVPAELADKAGRTARSARADVLVCVGGGSAIGLAKAVAAETGLPIVAVPTTYSGSEMTPVYGVTNTRKVTRRDPRVLPRVAIYDPDLTVRLPPYTTATSGLNAVAHCVEASYGPHANPLSDGLVEQAMRLLTHSLPIATRQPYDIEARTDALLGAHLAGTAMALAGTALHHRLCHILGGEFGLVHAEVHAVLIPYVAGFNGYGDLFGLARALGAPASLAEIGMPYNRLDTVARQAAGTWNSRPIDEQSIRALLEDAYQGSQR